MKYTYYNLIVFLLLGIKTNAQEFGTMSFGEQTIVFVQSQNPQVNETESLLLNKLNITAISSGPIYSAIALDQNGAGTDAIGSDKDAVLGWFGNGNYSVTSGTLSNNNGTTFSLESMLFAYEHAVGNKTLNFVLTGKKNNIEVGSLDIIDPNHKTQLTLDFSNPTTGSFTDIDSFTITPSEPIFGGFSIDDIEIKENALLNSIIILNPTNLIDLPTLVTTELTIKSNIEVTNINIYDITGKIIIAKKNTNSISTQILSNGIYICKIELINGFTQRYRFVKN